MSATPPDAEQFPAGGAILLDALGARGIETHARGRAPERAVLLDLAGRLNKRTDRYDRRFLMAVGQVAELVAELTVAGTVADADTFNRELDAALERRSGGDR